MLNNGNLLILYVNKVSSNVNMFLLAFSAIPEYFTHKTEVHCLIASD